jgi:RNA polymerase sigma-70 factor (ECF subfamily)
VETKSADSDPSSDTLGERVRSSFAKTASPDASIATRASLLDRLRDVQDQPSWQRFFDTYWRLIHGVALKAGLTEVEAQEVVQETVISVARHLPEFRYDPKVCSFKTWMLRLTRWRIIDQLRKRMPGAETIEPLDDATALARLDELTGGKAPELEAVWNEEWEKAVLARAIEQLKPRVSPDQFQMFDLYVLRRMPVTEVARLLGTNVARVYLAKHRLSKMLRETIGEFEKAESGL